MPARVTRSCKENSPGLRERNHVRRIGREATGALSSFHTRCTSRNTREIDREGGAARRAFPPGPPLGKNSIVDNLLPFANSRSHDRDG